jgi:hypothetical protein
MKWKGFGSDHGIIKILSWHLPGETKEILSCGTCSILQYVDTSVLKEHGMSFFRVKMSGKRMWPCYIGKMTRTVIQNHKNRQQDTAYLGQ